MGTDHDISSLRTQLTVVRWHLDASVHAAGGATREHRERAQEAFDRVVRTLARLRITPTEREALEQELAALRSRLEAV